jgi:4-amino-4-deoxy-L-arabinose transferase-like glycosyltransferase
MLKQQRWFWALALATLGIYFWGLGSIPLLSFNEARRGVPVQEMLTSGDWLIPTLNHHLYISKPPLLYWLAAIPALLMGSASEWAIRLPSALAALGVTWFSFFIVRRHFGLVAAVTTVIVLITSAGFTTFARRAEIEMLLAACCSASVLSAFEYIFGAHDRKWLNLVFVFIGLALLAKGPVALLFYIPLLLVFWWRYRVPQAMECLTHWRGWLIALLIALPWYLAVSLKLGWDIWSHVVETDMAGKIERAQADPLYQYPLWLIADFLPWCLLALLSPVKHSKRWVASPKSGFMLIAAVVPLVLFSLMANKHAKYLLPSYPAWAILFALVASELYQKLSAQKQRWVVGASAGLVMAFFVFYAVGEAKVFKHRYQALPQMAKTFAQYSQIPVYALHEVDPRAVFYRGQPMPVLEGADILRKASAGERFLLFVEDKSPDTSWPLCKLAEFSPYLKQGHRAAIYGSGDVCK